MRLSSRPPPGWPLTCLATSGNTAERRYATVGGALLAGWDVRAVPVALERHSGHALVTTAPGSHLRCGLQGVAVLQPLVERVFTQHVIPRPNARFGSNRCQQTCHIRR